jgi:hypothetical protein
MVACAPPNRRAISALVVAIVAGELRGMAAFADPVRASVEGTFSGRLIRFWPQEPLVGGLTARRWDERRYSCGC